MALYKLSCYILTGCRVHLLSFGKFTGLLGCAYTCDMLKLAVLTKKLHQK